MIEPDDVIQIVPGHKWGLCLATVADVKSWGVIAWVRMPTNDGAPPGDAFIRLATGEYEAIGAKAVWGGL